MLGLSLEHHHPRFLLSLTHSPAHHPHLGDRWVQDKVLRGDRHFFLRIKNNHWYVLCQSRFLASPRRQPERPSQPEFQSSQRVEGRIWGARRESSPPPTPAPLPPQSTTPACHLSAPPAHPQVCAAGAEDSRSPLQSTCDSMPPPPAGAAGEEQVLCWVRLGPVRRLPRRRCKPLRPHPVHARPRRRRARVRAAADPTPLRRAQGASCKGSVHAPAAGSVCWGEGYCADTGGIHHC